MICIDPRSRHALPLRALVLSGVLTFAALPSSAAGDAGSPATSLMPGLVEGEVLPTGVRITPEAAPGAVFQSLNPDLPTRPGYLADHAVAVAIGPDGTTMLVLTSGYNRNNGPTGASAPAESKENVFVYDIAGGAPAKTQVLQIPNTYNGIAWNPDGSAFYVAGGVDDNVHVFKKPGSAWAEDGTPIPLGHGNVGVGLLVRPMAAGMAVNDAGDRLLVANYYNDSVSLIDLDTRSEIGELDLRPGKLDPSKAGVAGGEYPFAVAFAGNDKAYVSSQRDREIVVMSLAGDALAVSARIKTRGQPNNMVVNGARLYVACDNSDSVVVIDTGDDRIVEEIGTTAPTAVFPNPAGFKGSNPNNLALSPDEGTLFVSNGGTNTVAVIQLGGPQGGKGKSKSQLIGLIPTGWYPSGVAVSPDGGMLYVVNGKSDPGANPDGCRDTLSIAAGSLNPCRAANQYVWQLEKAGLLSLPMPDAHTLADLTWQSADNNDFPTVAARRSSESMMAFLRARIKHVIYVVKENRTYDQLLGDLKIGDGDPDLAILGPYSPNHQELALQFITFDRFHDAGETSNTGWNWTTAARSTDALEKIAPVNYAGRGLSYEAEGTSRNINVGFATAAERQAANPYNPADPDLLPGTADIVGPDAPEGEGAAAGAGYLWDSALRAGLDVRNYGFYGDLARYFLAANDPAFIALSRHPFADGVVQFIPAKQSLMDISDPYFRGYDQKCPDYWRFKEWEREFDQYAAGGNLPNLSLVRFPHDHFGDFAAAIDGVNTVETEMADNDYAVGLLIEKVANSPYKADTLIFVIEDDAQDGGDHVNARRSIGYIVGPYVKQGGVVVSTHYTTVNMLRTIEDVLGIVPLGLNDGLAAPMADAFDRKQEDWSYTAIVPEILHSTQLPVPAAAAIAASATPSVTGGELAGCFDRSKRTPEYWAAAMAGQNFTVEDQLDAARFNQALWTGLAGADKPYPAVRHGGDLRANRGELLAQYRNALTTECGVDLSGN